MATHRDQTAIPNTPAFSAGYDAFYAGEITNPYLEGTKEPWFTWAREWQRGFNYAYFKQLRKTRAIERNKASKERARVQA